MGGTTFDHYQSGTDVKDAFDRAREDAGHEHGHGGYSGTIAEKHDYVVITSTPLIMTEAYALAGVLEEKDDPRISDKWGPAGAIPVLSETRQVSFKGVTYVHDNEFREYDKPQPELLKAVQAQAKLKKGETIRSIQVHQYSTPDARQNSYSSFRNGPPLRVTRSECAGTIVINKAPMTRKETVSVIIPGGLNFDDRDKAIQSELDSAVKLRLGEKRIGYRQLTSVAGKPKVTVVAPKAKTETRFIVKGAGRGGHGLSQHGTWETGFASQAEARAWLTKAVENPKNWETGMVFHGDDVTFEVESVTRRVDGQPLVSVRRQVAGHIVDVEVVIRLMQSDTPTTPDGWLFFGWASC